MLKVRNRLKVILCMILMFSFANLFSQVKAASSNNFLADVSFDVGVLDTKFDSNTINYDLTLPKDTKSVKVTAVASDSKAKVSIGGANLSTGKVVITVTAENGAKKYYTFFVKYGNVTTTATTTTKKPETTTTTATTTTESSSSSEVEESEVTTSGNSSSVNVDSSALLFLAVKEGKLNRPFESNLFEYTALVDDVNAEYELEYITESDRAVVNVTKSKEKYVIEVINETAKTTYVINLKDRNENAITAEDSLMSSVIKDLLISFVLLVISILFFYQSRRLSKE